ncbi:gasdermin-E-like [Mugil cephalus]|uniref:gasdermin-E-like n=1 Tax=Mugil cephalus TaxID=48193 RepID=UPI001FB76BEB|nr:gasdermin-E-like [Mugil cephalus]
MFSKATANLVCQIDPEGSLIPVSRLNDSDKLNTGTLVIKRKRPWFWQRPKYQPTDFTLSNLLLGEEVLTPDVSDKEFLTYKGTFGDTLSGELESEVGALNVTFKGRGASKLQSFFGKLKKEELDVKKLLNDSDHRCVDMQHLLMKQIEKHAEVLAIVKERIITTDTCSITQTKTGQCTVQGVLGLISMLGDSFKVCVKDSNNMELDSDVSLEIPSGTVIAYGVLELDIKQDGQYDICLRPSATGGIEADSLSLSEPADDFLDMVDSKLNGQNAPETVALNSRQYVSEKEALSPLAELPQSTRSALMKNLQETLRDRAALSYLQCELEERYMSIMEEQLETELVSDSHGENGQASPTAHLSALHLLVSAMEELPDEALSLLSESGPELLQALDTLMCTLAEPLSIPSLPAPLQDSQAFQLAQRLLGSIKVTLRRDTNKLWTDRRDDARALLCVLCLSVHGLSLLTSTLN